MNICIFRKNQFIFVYNKIFFILCITFFVKSCKIGSLPLLKVFLARNTETATFIDK